MDATDVFILILMGLALAVVFYYRKTLGDVWTLVLAALAGVAAGSAVLLRKRNDDRAATMVEATLTQNEKQVRSTVKKLNDLVDKKRAIDAKHEAAKDSSNPDEPDTNVVDFLKRTGKR